MVSGIGLDVIKYSGNEEALFSFKWYDQWECRQELKVYYDLWRRHFKGIKAMYVPFMFDGIQQLVFLEEFRI